jgi:hypothetical protein
LAIANSPSLTFTSFSNAAFPVLLQASFFKSTCARPASFPVFLSATSVENVPSGSGAIVIGLGSTKSIFGPLGWSSARAAEALAITSASVIGSSKRPSRSLHMQKNVRRTIAPSGGQLKS